MKTCFKCKSEKPESEFYKHRMMASGLLGKCKECTRLDVRKNRLLRADYYKQFDRNRANLPHRVSARKQYSKTDAYKHSHAKSSRIYKEKYPERASARAAVSNAVRDKRIFPMPCLICGNDVSEAHHADYSNPLGVIWLCTAHHKEVHKMAKQMIESPF